MQLTRRMLTLPLLMGLAGATSAQEAQPVTATVHSIGLFKNGLAVVRSSIEVSGNGRYTLNDLPSSVHGAFWIESDAVVETRATTRKFKVPFDPGAAGAMQQDIVDRTVLVTLTSGGPALRGAVLATSPTEATWSTRYEQPSNSWWGGGERSTWQGPQLRDRYLALGTKQGTMFIERSKIATLLVEGDLTHRTVERSVLEFDVREVGSKVTRVEISYLAKGMAWAPSYAINRINGEHMTLEQSAVIRNELFDLEGVEVSLISGFPAVEFSHVLSPMASSSNWASFFQQLNQKHGAGNSASTQQLAITSNAVSPNAAIPDNLPSSTGDVHYHSIGKRSLLEGDTLFLSVAKSECDFESMVEWRIPDSRDEHGARIVSRRYREKSTAAEYEPWDAIRFRNPFGFPMTTAPASILEAGVFRGQTLSSWVGPGNPTSLRVTKALSIAARHHEQELEDSRSMTGSRSYDTTVKGVVEVANQRSSSATVVVHRTFSGTLLDSEGDPRQRLKATGVYSVNVRRELVWTIELQPGESRTLEYSYRVHVRN